MKLEEVQEHKKRIERETGRIIFSAISDFTEPSKPVEFIFLDGGTIEVEASQSLDRGERPK